MSCFVHTYNEQVISAISNICDEVTSHPKRVEIIVSGKTSLAFRDGGCPVAYILDTGEVELCSTKNDMVISNFRDRTIIGLSTGFFEQDFFYIRTVTEVKLFRINLNDLTAIIENKQMWKDACVIISWNLGVCLSTYNVVINSDSIYSIVKVYLEMLWNEHRDNLSGIAISNFILRRAPISRSSLTKILKELTDGGYIEVKRGRLVSLNKLPMQY